MPIYNYICKKCDYLWDELSVKFEPEELIKTLVCEKCGSKRIKYVPSWNIASVNFSNPKDTSKWDNFDYRAKFNMEKAKLESYNARKEAEAKGLGSPYKS